MSTAKTLRTPRPDVAMLAADAQDRLRSLETLILAAESLADHRRVHAALMVCADSDSELAKQLNLACEDWREPALAPDVPGGDRFTCCCAPPLAWRVSACTSWPACTRPRYDCASVRSPLRNATRTQRRGPRGPVHRTVQKRTHRMTGALLMLLWAFLAFAGAAAVGIGGAWLLLPTLAGGWLGYRLAARRLVRLAKRRAQGKTNCPFLASTWWP